MPFVHFLISVFNLIFKNFLYFMYVVNIFFLVSDMSLYILMSFDDQKLQILLAISGIFRCFVVMSH